MIWIQLFICGGLLTFFAYNLCKEGVILSEKTHMEEGVIGIFFLAVATSFPEIVVGATSVFSFGKIGLGYGDLVGSVIVNSMLLFALDLYTGRGRMLRGISRLNLTTAFFVLGVSCVIFTSSVLRVVFLPKFSIFGFLGPESLLIIAAYFIYLRILKREGASAGEGIYHAEEEPFWKVWAKFIFLLVVVMLLGVWMARIGDRIVEGTGLSETFTGTLILGVATSLPEIIVSFAAIRAASADMAVGNILGSNLFDMCVIPLLDFLSEKPLLGLLTPGQILSTLIVIIITAITIFGIASRRDTERKVGWDTALIFTVGFIGFVILYFVS